MNENRIEGELKSQFAVTGRAILVENSTLAADPLLAKISQVVDGAANDPAIQAAIIWILNSGECPAGGEILRYFAYRYRWLWLKEEIEHRRADHKLARDMRGERAYEWMLEAFDDDWDDIDFYPSLQIPER
ncbi:hypothetical protein DFR70_1325 [Nocardia tenerifensis]|uniref:Uncharacterized protein n=1 Tax=Nocardia tenerifensis TaxID=228006 RepID=A0A318JRG9_9NOCA|nr:hypothetical protein [Nocardia tenerifensis]PXX52620.1 hypothetical protein DFR70_1325 [Nocardia tenerifensis]